MKFRRPKFSLRTLLLLITVGTIVCWGYFIGLPKWKLHLEQQRFIDAIQQLKTGMTISQLAPQARKAVVKFPTITTGWTARESQEVNVGGYFFTDRFYFVVFVVDNSQTLSHLEILQLDLMPPEFPTSAMARYKPVSRRQWEF